MQNRNVGHITAAVVAITTSCASMPQEEAPTPAPSPPPPAREVEFDFKLETWEELAAEAEALEPSVSGDPDALSLDSAAIVARHQL